jgi:predicted ATP-grasp superfamily ATP-dependent carboligase
LKVLVTDGHLKTALSAVRSLGRRGYEIHTKQNRPGGTLSSFSCYHRRSHLLPKYEDARKFRESLLILLQNERFDSLLVSSEGAVRALSALAEEVSVLTRVDLPPAEDLDTVLSKTGLIRFAQKTGIPVPKTVIAENRMEPAQVCRELQFPIVAKSALGDTYDRVTDLNSAEELHAFLNRWPAAGASSCSIPANLSSLRCMRGFGNSRLPAAPAFMPAPSKIQFCWNIRFDF